MRPSFLGIGVEKAATSWIYACMYEHPQLCLPYKEINFFSREEKWKKGISWYEEQYEKRCSNGKALAGEFSTEYLFTEQALERIAHTYPNIKLLVSLRDPVDRAFSQYYNSIKAGTLDPNTSFTEALETDVTYLGQGRYKKQLNRLFDFIPREQLHILIYEDIESNALLCTQNIFRFLGVDSNFVPSQLENIINSGRIPKNLKMESSMNTISEKLQESIVGDKIWWIVKNSGLPSLLRNVNTKEKKNIISKEQYYKIATTFKEDIVYVEELLNRKLNWNFEKEV